MENLPRVVALGRLQEAPADASRQGLEHRCLGDRSMHVQGTPVLNCPAREAVIYPTTPDGPLWYFPEDEGGVRLPMTVGVSLDMMAGAA